MDPATPRAINPVDEPRDEPLRDPPERPHRTYLPNALAIRAWITRSALLWVGLRLLAAILVFRSGGHPFPASIALSVLLVIATAVVTVLDVGIRKERALLGNLGVSRMQLALIGGVAGTGGEVMVHLIVGAG